MIIGNTLWSFIGIGLFAISQWMIVIVISKKLGPEYLGFYSYAMAIAAPVFGLSNLQLRAHFATDKKKRSLETYFGIRFITSGTAFFIVIGISLFVDNSIYFLLLVTSVCILKYCDSLSDLTYAVFQRKKLLKLTSISMILRGVIGAIVTIFLIIVFNDAIIGLIGGGLVWLMVFLLYDFNQLEKNNYIFKPSYSIESVKILKETAFMGLAVMVSSLAMNVPRYYLKNYYGIENLGIFTAQVYIVSLFGMFSAALSTAISTDLKNNAFTDNKKFMRIICYSLFFLSILTLLLAVIVYSFEYEILSLIYSEKFIQKNSNQMLILTFSCFFWGASCILDYGLISIRKLVIRPLVALVTIIAMVISWHLAYRQYTNDIGGIMMLVGGCTQSILYFSVLIICIRKYQK